MATLRNVRGQSLVGDASQGLGILREAFGTPGSRRRDARQEELDVLRQEAILGALGTTPGSVPATSEAVSSPGARDKAQQRLAILAPPLADAWNRAITSQDTRAQAAIRREVEEGARMAAFVKRQPPEKRAAALKSIGADMLRQGKQPDRALELMNKTPEEQDLAFDKMILAARDFGKVAEPLTELAKAREDLAAGRITQEDFDSLTKVKGKPGVDTPFSEAVLKQKIALAQAGSAQTNINVGDSPIGKLVNDRRALIAEGATPDSPPVKAIDAKLKKAGEQEGLNKSQSDALTFSTRMETANATLDALEDVAMSVTQNVAGEIPLFGNFLVKDEFQDVRRAQRDFLNAVLRRESGAVISDDEFDQNTKIYFPAPGDGPQTVAAKREARRLALENMRNAADPNFRPGPREETTVTPQASQADVEIPSASGEASGLPQGAVLVGKSPAGNDVFRLQDGSLVEAVQ